MKKSKSKSILQNDISTDLHGMELSGSKNEKSSALLTLLKSRYKNPQKNLIADNPWQQLVATILSAQCTDARINMITPKLFKIWPSPKEMASATPADVEDVINSITFYKAKATNIIKTANMIMDNFNGEVPHTLEELVTLPGVARKTANVVLYTQFGINEGIAVDTHVKRISQRIGLTKKDDPYDVEKDLMPIFPKEEWGFLNQCMVHFGREICTAKNPKCSDCDALSFCDYGTLHSAELN